MNRVLQFAEKIWETTGRLCTVGPGPYGFGMHTDESSEIGIVLALEPNPYEDDVTVPEDADISLRVEAFNRAENTRLTLEEVAAYVSSEKAETTRRIATAFLELAKESGTANVEECHEAFDLMVKYDLGNDRSYLDLEPYVPEDGAALRYSSYQMQRGGKWFGGGHRYKHIGWEDIIADGSITDSFARSLSLEEITIDVTHYVYGDGETVRDVNEKEADLVVQGAFDGMAKETKRQFTVKREDLALPPVSPLTERGMSLFFTAAAEMAEAMGFTVGGIVDEQLQISHDGKVVVQLCEDGSGSHIYLRPGEPASVLFSTGPEEPSALSVGEEGQLNNDIRRLIAAAKEARARIPEVLHPHDYTFLLLPDAYDPEAHTPEQEGPRL